MVELALLAIVAGVILTGAAYDAATLTIPNWISLALLALFPVLAVSTGLGWGAFGAHLAVGFVALIIGMGLFSANIIGGGDAKLFAAVALYMGFGLAGAYVFAVAIAGGILAAAMLAIRWLAASPYGAILPPRLAGTQSGMPYGIAIAAGGLFVLPATQFFILASAGI